MLGRALLFKGMPIIDKSFESDKFTAVYLVEEVHEGQRLDQFLKIYLGKYSREKIKAKIKRGEIKIEGRPGTHRPSTILHYGERVLLTTHRGVMEDEYWRGEKLELDLDPEVVYEDDGLIVANKPPFMTTHPTGRHLFNCATVYFSNIHQKTIHSIHRIDRETSGIQLLGKTSKVAGELTTEFEERRVLKCYLFISKVAPDFEAFEELVARERMGSVSKGKDRVYMRTWPSDSEEGKSAHTTFHCVHREGNYLVGVARPKTGRQHQIRVHAKEHGFPLLGDKLYLGSYEMFQRFKDGYSTPEDCDLMELPRHALHALALNISYRGSRRTYMCSLPEDFKAWITQKLSISPTDLTTKLETLVAEVFNER